MVWEAGTLLGPEVHRVPTHQEASSVRKGPAAPMEDGRAARMTSAYQRPEQRAAAGQSWLQEFFPSKVRLEVLFWGEKAQNELQNETQAAGSSAHSPGMFAAASQDLR